MPASSHPPAADPVRSEAAGSAGPVRPAPAGLRATVARLAVIVGITALVLVAVVAKDALGDPGPGAAGANGELPAITLERAVAANEPTLAFFHSLTCDSCVEMTAVVEEVYPEFEGSVTLVDVDVYDERNADLLRQARIVAIPTVVLIDRAGSGEPFIGVMNAGQLRERLRALVGEG